jgi:hypothetical protein
MTTEPVSPPQSETEDQGLPLGVWIGIGVGALVLAVLVIVRVASPLAALLFPAEPPFFAPASLIEHRTPYASVDEWLYASDVSGCEIYDWYYERATSCTPSMASSCDGSGFLPSQDGSYSVGYCYGRELFGDFAADWEIYISDGYNDAAGRARFLIAREIDWINQD